MASSVIIPIFSNNSLQFLPLIFIGTLNKLFMNTSLSGRSAVICGSTQGIGLAIAWEFAAAGAHCILLARNEKVLVNVVDQLQQETGIPHHYEVADFSVINQVESAIERIIASHSIQILVNNTGGPPAGPIVDSEEAAFLQAFNQHLVCNHLLTKAVIPSMKLANYGRIINIISTSVKTPLKNLGVSNTIRGAVASWSKTMSYELGEFNITVNNLLPGFINTQRIESLIAVMAKKRGVAEEVIREEMKQDVPLKRFGEASELAAVAAFLASPAASYVNGVNLPVDGGKTNAL